MIIPMYDTPLIALFGSKEGTNKVLHFCQLYLVRTVNGGACFQIQGQCQIVQGHQVMLSQICRSVNVEFNIAIGVQDNARTGLSANSTKLDQSNVATTTHESPTETGMVV